MSIFEAALQAIQTHRCYSIYDMSKDTGWYSCHGCAWTGPNTDAADRHVAGEIDGLVD